MTIINTLETLGFEKTADGAYFGGFGSWLTNRHVMYVRPCGGNRYSVVIDEEVFNYDMETEYERHEEFACYGGQVLEHVFEFFPDRRWR